MIRSYREIGKPASVLMFTGAGLSQSSIIVESDNVEVFIHLGINGTKYKVKQYLSTLFKSSLMADLTQRLYTTIEPVPLRDYGVSNVSKISLHPEPIGEHYTSLADSSYKFNEIESATMYGIKFKEKQIIAKRSGTMKSCGLDVTTLSETDTIPVSTSESRTVAIKNNTLTSYIGSVINNFYHAKNKCFYVYQNGNIYKIPFDFNTFTFGEVTTAATGFLVYSTTYGFVVTNLFNELYVQTKVNEMKVFNFDDESIRVYTINLSGLSTASSNIAWDFKHNVIRSARDGFTISPYGIVTSNTGKFNGGTSNVYYFADKIVYTANAKVLNNLEPGILSDVKIISAMDGPFGAMSTMQKFLMMDEQGIVITLTYTNTNLVFRWRRIPSEYTTLGESQGIAINEGDVINVSVEINIK